MDFSFCETATATGTSPWHLRVLSEKGKMLGGGADTPALCGREVCWDLDVDITKHHLTHSCKACVEKMLEAVAAGGQSSDPASSGP